MIQKAHQLFSQFSFYATESLDRIPVFSSLLDWLHKDTFCEDVERYPLLSPEGETTLKNCYVIGDLTGIPLLKMASNGGSDMVKNLHRKGVIQSGGDTTELIIVGAGVAGISAAMKASQMGIPYRLFESNRSFSTIANFPQGKPIFLEPRELEVTGELKLSADTKETLLAELNYQLQNEELPIIHENVEEIQRSSGSLLVKTSKGDYQSKAVLLAIGKSGNHRKLNVEGEELGKVINRLLDPKELQGKRVLVVGGGDSALEAATSCASHGAKVTISYRKSEFSRPKEGNLREMENHQQQGRIEVLFNSDIERITEDKVHFKNRKEALPNDAVLSMIGKELPLNFFKRCKIRLEHEWDEKKILACLTTILAFTFFYLWKKGIFLSPYYSFSPGWKPAWFSLDAPFLYGMIYSILVFVFGIRRMKRKPTRYIRLQTWTLIFFQVITLWILPTMLIPWLGSIGLIPAWFKTQVLMVGADSYLTGGNCWRAYGLVLAWPLFPFLFLEQNPTTFWLIFGSFQSFVLIPWLIYHYGKGAYCGWVCGCGALAETVGDSLRTLTPHGPKWKKVENWGQVFLFVVSFLTLMNLAAHFTGVQSFRVPVLYDGFYSFYSWVIDFAFANVLGVGLYLFLGGRFWCRLFCPLAALMHIYTKFSRYRIFADKSKCISCNVCTKVCHQGIDVMNFANKGLPMNDVQCVRCSACVVECPTGVLSFGKLKAGSNSEPGTLEQGTRMQ